MAEKKEHKIVSASDGTKKTTKSASGKTIKEAAPTGSSAGYRAGAIILWLLALGCEAVGILTLVGKLNISFIQSIPTLWFIIGVLVVDLIFVIIGSQLWKKANHIKPASKKNPVLFWLWNNMGVIVCIIAFLPYIIVLLKDKNLDKKTRTIAIVAAVVALVIGGLTSIDYNPISEEEKAAAQQVIDGNVLWAPFGKVYHTHEDCGSLNHSDTLTEGTVEEAIAAGRTRLCSFCARKDEIDTTGLLTDGADVDEED